MTVTLKEIRRLQEDVASKIKVLTDAPEPDYKGLSRLRSLNFSISMIFLQHSMEKDSTEIELKTDDDARIIEALKPFRKTEIQHSNTPTDFLDHLFVITRDMLNDIADLEETLANCRGPQLRENISERLSAAYKALSEIESLQTNKKTLTLWRQNRVEMRSEAASIMGRAKSEKKSRAARENGKKGGRPKKTQAEVEEKHTKETKKRKKA